MKQCTGGDGSNTTAAVQTYLLNNAAPNLKTLYLIGHAEDPFALWLTDYESPLTWSLYGTFQPAVVTRGTIKSKIGLESTSLDIFYSPKYPRTFGITTATASPMQLAQLGFYDNWPVRVWTVFMPTPGDANTLGTCELFGGIVGDTKVDRTGISLTVNSFLYVMDQSIPPNVIEMTNTIASVSGAIPPAGLTVVPTFTVPPATTVSTSSFSGQCLGPTPGQIFSNNAFAQGYMVFTSGTLQGFWSAVSSNFSAGGFNAFTVYTPFPWPPSSGDQFYVSAKSPIDQTDTSAFFGFPYVPDPTQAL